MLPFQGRECGGSCVHGRSEGEETQDKGGEGTCPEKVSAEEQRRPRAGC